MLRSAGCFFEWAAGRSATWQQVPKTPPYAALREPLASAGLDPDMASRPAHDDCLSQLRERAAAWSVQQGAAGFVAGAWSAPAAWLSALPGVLIARAMPADPLGGRFRKLCDPSSSGPADVFARPAPHRGPGIWSWRASLPRLKRRGVKPLPPPC